MEKLNLPPFYVGQKVVHVGTPYRTLGKNTVHIVEGVRRIPCGCYVLDIHGEPSDIVYAGPASHSDCGWYGFNPSPNRCGFSTSDFRPLQESKFKAVTFEKICEEVELICEN